MVVVLYGLDSELGEPDLIASVGNLLTYLAIALYSATGWASIFGDNLL